MKIHLAKYEPDRIGGGWTFMRNFAKGMSGVLSSYEEADVYFVSSPSIVSREEVEAAKRDGKKIVLRLDNAVRNSRNRNTGMTRMKDFADWADLIVFQSEWALEYLRTFLARENRDYYFNKPIAVILNGVDTALYYPPKNKPDADTILYSRFNRDETKNYEAARYWYSQYYVTHPGSTLYIVGQFSPELQAGNFDFYNNEAYRYLGTLPPLEMADLYRNCRKLLFTFYNDACSNTLIEALVSGCELAGDKYYRDTGGSMEIIKAYLDGGAEHFSIKRMCDEYMQRIGSIL